jgi:L-iditol 2-dehydrogenase
MGACRIVATDISDYRLEAAKKFGADDVVNAKEDVPARVRELNGGKLAEVVLVCTGAVSAIDQALASVDRGGTVLLFAPTDPGITVPMSVTDLFFSGGVTVTSSYAGSPADHMTAVELIRAGSLNVRDMITHRLGLADTGKGFKLVADAKESMKVVIEPQK